MECDHQHYHTSDRVAWVIRYILLVDIRERTRTWEQWFHQTGRVVITSE